MRIFCSSKTALGTSFLVQLRVSCFTCTTVNRFPCIFDCPFVHFSGPHTLFCLGEIALLGVQFCFWEFNLTSNLK